MQTNLNKEKIQTLINQQRKTLADVEYLDLDSVAKILQNFENPSISANNLRQGSEIYKERAEVLGKSGTHSFFVSNVLLYENPTKEQTLPLTLRGNTDFDRIVDAKLQQFFEYANGNGEDNPQLSYTLIALPLAYILVFPLNLGPCGTFLGIAIGLLIAAILYKKRLKTIIIRKKYYLCL